MEILIIKDKQQYLEDNYPFENVPKLTDKKTCIHCGKRFTVGDYVVIKHNDFEYLCCANAPECNGTVIDWIPYK